MSQSPGLESFSVESPDGARIAVWNSGSGPPLLLVHGSMSDHTRWRITDALARHRTVYAMDRRGRGGSSDGPHWSVDREVEDVVAVIDTVADRADSPVDVLGHSLGGYLVLRATARSAHVRRVVAYEPAIVPAGQPAELVARMKTAADAGRNEEVAELMLREVLHMPQEEISALRAQPTWPARVASAPTLPREESVPLLIDDIELTAIRCPTLLIGGGDSPAFLQEAIRTVADGVAHAQVIMLPGQQHVADQLIPEEFAQVVLRFLISDEGQ
ncbi:alpha/beta fold hydrolase [Nostocoides sp. F2B08]|uniref:alpha/beta fold hydrolase n=1 Tax=Nostocoides sp. F2B08 TaxID=2653936 RepID=UPI00186B08E8|nr:alpha/beta hydrolase [Tetrasphaera sp. F2B08]